MKVAIVGTGHLGSALAYSLAKGGHDIIFGARNLDDQGARRLASATGAHLLAPDSAADQADVTIFAIPAEAVVSVARSLSDKLHGKAVIVPANEPGKPGLDLAGQVAQVTKNSRVIRTFNTIAAETLGRAHEIRPPVDMFYAADAGVASEIAERLIHDAGLHPVRLGDLNAAGMVDQVFEIWAALAFSQRHGRSISLAVRSN